MHPDDNVGVVMSNVTKGDICYLNHFEVTAKEDIPFGHKIALVDLAVNENIIKYCEKIGYAICPIFIGAWVHSHNIESERGR